MSEAPLDCPCRSKAYRIADREVSAGCNCNVIALRFCLKGSNDEERYQCCEAQPPVRRMAPARGEDCASHSNPPPLDGLAAVAFNCASAAWVFCQSRGFIEGGT